MMPTALRDERQMSCFAFGMNGLSRKSAPGTEPFVSIQVLNLSDTHTAGPSLQRSEISSRLG